MNEVHQKIISAIIQKAEAVCPNSLALIGLYGSVATGDTHEKSDLDLMILVNDEQGHQLSEAFILNDTGIGYDLYCTSWAMLEEDAKCHHAHLSKLFDATLVYIKNPGAVQRLEKLRKKAFDLLASDERYKQAQAALSHAKVMYANCFLTDSIAQMRMNAGAVIHFLLDAVMLYHGQYFRKGVKRTFEELESLNLTFPMEEKVMNVIQAETDTDIKSAVTDLMKTVQANLLFPHGRISPDQNHLAGTYEEMVSNWQSKMCEAADRKNIFCSFMNMVACQGMLDEITENIAIKKFNMMAHFDPRQPEQNLKFFQHTLDSYLEAYRQVGLHPHCFASVDDFVKAYLTLA